MTPIAAGLRSSAASRLLRVCGESSSATPWRASSSERSSWSRPARGRRAAALGRGRLVARACRAGRAPSRRRPPRRTEQRADAREHRAQAALRSGSRRGASSRSRNARSVALRSRVVPPRPLERRGQPRAAVELARVAAAGVPLARRVAQVVVQPPALGVLLEPAAQPRPLAQQRLVRDLDLALADRDEAARRRARRGRRRRPRRGRPRARRAPRGAGPRRRPRPRRRAAAGSARAASRCAWVEARVGALGEPGDRAAHAARALVGAQAQRAAVALLPQLEQRGRQQRQRAGLALDVGDQRVDELGLDAQAGAAGGQLDRAAQLVAAHRPDEHVVGAEQPRQLGVAGAAAVEVGAHGDQHERAAAGSRAAASSASTNAARSRLVAAGGEELLELVDGDQPRGHRRPPRSPLERAQRMLAGAQQRHAPSARCPGSTPARQRGQQPGAQRRGLAAARRADDRPAAARPRAARPSRRPVARGRRRTPASSTSNDARPLNGHATTSARRASAARSRSACSSTTVPASSSSAARRPVRSAAARPAAPPSRRRGLRARPLRGESMHALRGCRRCARAAARPGSRALGAYGARSPRPRLRRAGRSAAARRPVHAARVLGGREEPARALEASSVEVPGRLAHVVEHEQRRARARRTRSPGRSRRGPRRTATGPRSRCTLAGQLGGEPRPADPARAGDHDQRDRHLRAPAAMLPQPGRAPRRARQRRVAVELGRQLEPLRLAAAPAPGPGQDRRVSSRSSLAGLDPESPTSRPARVRGRPAAPRPGGRRGRARASACARSRSR